MLRHPRRRVIPGGVLGSPKIRAPVTAARLRQSVHRGFYDMRPKLAVRCRFVSTIVVSGTVALGISEKVQGEEHNGLKAPDLRKFVTLLDYLARVAHCHMPKMDRR